MNDVVKAIADRARELKLDSEELRAILLDISVESRTANIRI
ncbi:MAG: hypothetical protein QXQ29_01555 [Candidatus Bathyarchaeia archaeon]